MKKKLLLIAALLIIGQGSVHAYAESSAIAQITQNGRNFPSWYDGSLEPSAYVLPVSGQYTSQKVNVTLDKSYYNIKGLKFYGPAGETYRVKVQREGPNGEERELFYDSRVYLDDNTGEGILYFNYNTTSRQSMDDFTITITNERAPGWAFAPNEIEILFYEDGEEYVKPIGRTDIWWRDYTALYDGNKKSDATHKSRSVDSPLYWITTDSNGLTINREATMELNIYMVSQNGSEVDNIKSFRFYNCDENPIPSKGFPCFITLYSNDQQLQYYNRDRFGGKTYVDGVMDVEFHYELGAPRRITYENGNRFTWLIGGWGEAEAYDFYASELEVIADTSPVLGYVNENGEDVTSPEGQSEIGLKSVIFKKDGKKPFVVLGVNQNGKQIGVTACAQPEMIDDEDGNVYKTELLSLPNQSESQDLYTGYFNSFADMKYLYDTKYEPCRIDNVSVKQNDSLRDAVVSGSVNALDSQKLADVPVDVIITRFDEYYGKSLAELEADGTVSNEEIGKSIVFAGKTTASGGSFSIPVNINDPEGFYVVSVKAQGSEGVTTLQVVVPSDNMVQDILTDMNQNINSADDLYNEYINNEINFSILGVDMTAFDGLSDTEKADVAAYVYSKKGSGFTRNVAQDTNDGIFLAAMKNSENGAAMAAALEKYAGLITIDTSWMERSDVNYTTVFDKLYPARDFGSVENFKSQTETEVVLHIFNNFTWGNLYHSGNDSSELYINRDLLSGLNYTGFSNLSAAKQSDVCKDIADNSGFSSIESLVTFINNSISKKNSGTGSTSSGTSSGTKGSSKPKGSNLSAVLPLDGTMTNEPEKTDEPAKTVVFDDIADAAWAEKAVSALAEKNVISGDGNGKFRPNDNVTREEFAKMLCTAFGYEPESGNNVFDDVDENAWYAGYVLKMSSVGVVAGFDGSFGVGRNITRQDAAAMTLRILNFSNIVLNTEGSIEYADFDEISDYAAEAIRVLSVNKILQGSDGIFRPLSRITRAEAASMIYAAVNATGR